MTPTCRELIERAENLGSREPYDLVIERVEKVLALHADRHGWCIECSRTAGEMIPWPCPTVRILNGDEI